MTCRLGIASRPQACPFHEVKRSAGTILQLQGEIPGRIWYVREGQVALGTVSASGEEQSYAVRGPDSVVGIEGLLGSPTAFQAWALSDVVLCGLDAESFRAWLGELDSPIGAILKLTLQEATERASERHGLEGSAVQRVARFLLRSFRGESRDKPLGMSQQVLARTLGMRPETLSRALAELRRAEAIAPGRKLRLLNVAELEAAAGEAPDEARRT